MGKGRRTATFLAAKGRTVLTWATDAKGILVWVQAAIAGFVCNVCVIEKGSSRAMCEASYQALASNVTRKQFVWSKEAGMKSNSEVRRAL